MRTPLYDHNAKRKTVSVTLNSDLVARSAAHGINISRVAEAALIAAFDTVEKEKIHEELKQGAVWVADYVAKHGYQLPWRCLCLKMNFPKIGSSYADAAV